MSGIREICPCQQCFSVVRTCGDHVNTSKIFSRQSLDFWPCCSVIRDDPKDIYAAPGLHGYCATWQPCFDDDLGGKIARLAQKKVLKWFQEISHAILRLKRWILPTNHPWFIPAFGGAPVREVFVKPHGDPWGMLVGSPFGSHEKLLPGVCSSWSTKGTRPTSRENSLNVFRAVRDPWRPRLFPALQWLNGCRGRCKFTMQ